MKIKTMTVQGLKAGSEDGLEEGQFLAYASTFTRTPDSYGDVIAKGAFLDSIEAWEKSSAVLPLLFGHRMDDPDFNIGHIEEAKEDDHGLLVKGVLDLESPKGKQVYRLLLGKRVNQLSFAYDIIEDGRIKEGDREVYELRKLAVHEISIVPIGANQETEVLAVKGITDRLKYGRTLSAKNQSALVAARDSINDVLSSLGDEDTEDAKAEASGHTQGKDDEPSQAKSDDRGVNPSASAAVLHEVELDLDIYG